MYCHTQDKLILLMMHALCEQCLHLLHQVNSISAVKDCQERSSTHLRDLIFLCQHAQPSPHTLYGSLRENVGCSLSDKRTRILDGEREQCDEVGNLLHPFAYEADTAPPGKEIIFWSWITQA
jgi:hypothetical protein